MKIAANVRSDSAFGAAQSLISRLECDLIQLEPYSKYRRFVEAAAAPMSVNQSRSFGAVAMLQQQTHCLQTDEESNESILFYRGNQNGGGPLKCVFATDHSDYANLALDKFIGLDPKGIASLEIFSAIEPTCRMSVANLHRHLADMVGELHDAREIARRSAELASRIESLGISSGTKLRTGHVAHLVDGAVKDSQADLLILGAQGENAQNGSRYGAVTTAVLQQAQYPVLVLRIHQPGSSN